MIEKGNLFIFTSGEYSDYQVVTLCKAAEDIDMEETMKEYYALFPDERDNYLRNNVFINWAINTKKIAEELDYAEWHLDLSF